MGREEQVEEREVLDSIFPDEIHDISPTEFRVSITLDTGDEQTAAADDEDDDGEGGAPTQPIILLNVNYPETYPDEPPRLDITQPPNAARYAHLDIQSDKTFLLESLNPTIDENLGMAMVFALVSSLKEAAEELISSRKRAIEAENERRAAHAEAEENRKFEGEKVTRESFTAWIARFKQEMEEEAARKLVEQEAEEKKKRGGKVEEKKLTGKQLWEQGLAGKIADEEEEEGEGEDVVASMRSLAVKG